MAAKANECSSFHFGCSRDMPDKLHSARSRIIAAIIGLPVVVYACYRAATLSFTYDEIHEMVLRELINGFLRTGF